MFLSSLLREPHRDWQLVNPDTGAVVATRVEGAFDSGTRRRGLLGRNGLGRTALVIAPCYLVHTFFMRFPIDTVFVDRDGRVVRVRPDVRPGRVAGAWGAFATIELEAGIARMAGIERGQRLVLTCDDDRIT